MKRKEIEKIYIKKINSLRKNNEAYFSHDKPLISDSEYDSLKIEILNLEKRYSYLKNKNSPYQKVGYEPSNKFKKIKHLKPMLSLSNAFKRDDIFVSQANSFLDAIEGQPSIACTLDEAKHTIGCQIALLEEANQSPQWQYVNKSESLNYERKNG